MEKTLRPNTSNRSLAEKIAQAARFEAEAKQCINKEAAAAFLKAAARLRKEAGKTEAA